jgi:hypothetical protein
MITIGTRSIGHRPHPCFDTIQLSHDKPSESRQPDPAVPKGKRHSETTWSSFSFCVKANATMSFQSSSVCFRDPSGSSFRRPRESYHTHDSICHSSTVTTKLVHITRNREHSRHFQIPAPSAAYDACRSSSQLLTSDCDLRHAETPVCIGSPWAPKARLKAAKLPTSNQTILISNSLVVPSAIVELCHDSFGTQVHANVSLALSVDR